MTTIESWLRNLKPGGRNIVPICGGNNVLELQQIKAANASLSPTFLEKMKELFQPDVFIETGTFLGGTTAEAAAIFGEVHTIKVSPDLFQQAKQLFQHTDNVHVHQGDSAAVLKKILPGIKGRIVIWLDGLYSGMGTGRGSRNPPILREIQLIKHFKKTDSVLLINDIRLFFQGMNTSSGTSGYPTLRALIAAILEIDPAYCFEIIGDAAIAYPSADDLQVSSVVRGCTISRLYDENPDLIDSVLDAEEHIAASEVTASAAISQLCQEYGLTGAADRSLYYVLWAGLFLHANNQFAAAAGLFKRLLSIGFDHWRVQWYLARAEYGQGSFPAVHEALLAVLTNQPSYHPARELMTQLKAIMEVSAASGSGNEHFAHDLNRFLILSARTEQRFSIAREDIAPCLDDKLTNAETDAHYIYHTAWAARVLAKLTPREHIDIASSLSFISIASAFVPIRFYDYRPPRIELSNLSVGYADLNALPFPDNSIASLSCMHVIEHIGLGRYGDVIDPDGDLKAIRELNRVLSPQGDLLLVVPVGKPRIIFNAHRIYSYDQILNVMNGFDLVEYALVPDKKSDAVSLVVNAAKEITDQQRYGCGCFWFRKRGIAPRRANIVMAQ